MLKKTIKYEDYNGETRTEDFYFNLSKAEIAEMELSIPGGMSALIKKSTDSKNVPEIFKLFKSFILKAYGEKSDDGKRFIKSEELSNAFAQTEAFSELFMEIASNEDAAANFIAGIVPKEAGDKIKASKKETKQLNG